MKRITVTIGLFFFSHTLLSQVDSLDTSYLKNFNYDLKEKREIEFQSYVEDLRNYKKGDPIPSFMLDECFDNKRQFWNNPHTGISLRWKVLVSINDKKLLEPFIHGKDKRLKKKCEFKREKTTWINIKIPSINKSYMQLIKRRYRQLK